MKICSIEGCNKKHYAKGLCKNHYESHKAKENPEKTRARKDKWAKEHPERSAETKKRWAQQNPDKVRESNKRWKQNNREKVRKTARNYRCNHPDKFSHAQKNWKERNRDKVREYGREWKRNNPDNTLASSRRWTHLNREKTRQNSRKWKHENPQKVFDQSVRRRMQIGDAQISKDEWLHIMGMFDWRCFYCDDVLTKENRSIDHIVPLSRGGKHRVSNLLPCCRSCNSSKNDKLGFDWDMVHKLPKNRLQVWRDRFLEEMREIANNEIEIENDTENATLLKR